VLKGFEVNIKKINHQISVSEQITAADVQTIAQLGFKSIVCHRPDGEGADQPSARDIEAQALAAGLAFVHQPVETGKVRPEQGVAFGDLMQTLPHPVLAYCRSGTRSTTLWALSQPAHVSTADIVATAAQAGYDLSAWVRPTRP
jgi:sulfide:quinone oxidoreductase